MGITNKLIDLCQQHALGQVLTEWGDLTYDEVLGELYSAGYDEPDHDEIVVWEVFEDWRGQELAVQIQSVYGAFAEVASSALDKEYQ